MRYVKVNQGFLELTGYRREALAGKSVHEIDILDGATSRDLAVERLHAGAAISQMEASLRTADAKSKTVIVASHPIEVGAAACMLFSFADLHPRQKAEDALRESEARFAPRGGDRLGKAGNRAVGHERASEELTRLVKQTGHARSIDVSLRNKDGGNGYYLLSAETVTINGEQCLLTVMLDITARKQIEADLLVAIETVMHDTSWFGQEIVEKLASLTRQEPVGRPEAKVADLTPRIGDVFGLMA